VGKSELVKDVGSKSIEDNDNIVRSLDAIGNLAAYVTRYANSIGADR
jgi:hypothetical protein